MRLSPVPPALRESTKNGHGLVFLKLPHKRLALLHVGFAVQHEPGSAEHRAQKRRKRRGDFAELREDQHLLLLRGNDLGDLAQARELAAVALRPTRRRRATATGDCRFV